MQRNLLHEDAHNSTDSILENLGTDRNSVWTYKNV